MNIEDLIRKIVRDELENLIKGKKVLKKLEGGSYEVKFRDGDNIRVLVDQCALSIRAHSVLKAVECNTIADLKKICVSQLRSVRNCGKKTVKEIEELVFDLNQ